jgi:hypothetical protein
MSLPRLAAHSVNNIGSGALPCEGTELSTEYEQLLGKLLEEKRALLAKLSSDKRKRKEADDLRAEIRYIELELEHYSQGLRLFRSKGVPKVGRWGKPEQEDHASTNP